MAQFPLSDLLTGAKRLFTSVTAKKNDGTYQELNLEDNGGLKTSVISPLPEGTNIIGKMDINSLPDNLISVLGLKVDVQGKTSDFSFQDNQTTASEGNVLSVGTYKTLAIEIIGTSTTQLVKFWGLMTSGTKIPLSGVNISTLTTGTQTVGINEIWQFDISALEEIMIEIQSTNGSISVNGKVVA